MILVKLITRINFYGKIFSVCLLSANLLHVILTGTHAFTLGKAPISSLSIETIAPQMILFDYETGAILAQKNANEKFHPASLTKVMTAHLVMEKLHNGDITEQTMLPISEKAWKIGGSTMFLRVNSQAPVIDLLNGAIVLSGNDACIALAEGIWGREEYMVQVIMNTLKEWGLKDTNFTNVTGWPDPEHVTTARDLAIMAVHTFKDFPKYYPIYAKKDVTWEGRKQGNRNPLLYKDIGCDGIKTGHTEDSGYSLMATCQRNNRRLFLIIAGLPSMQARADEAKKMINWGFQVFDNQKVFKKEEILCSIPVKGAEIEQANLGVIEDVVITFPRFEINTKQISFEHPKQINAPLRKGDIIGTVKINSQSLVQSYEIPLVLMQDIPQASLWNNLKQTILKWIKNINPF